MNETRGVHVVVGDAEPVGEASKVVRLRVTSLERSDVIDAVRDCGLSATDVRTSVIVVVDSASEENLAAYAALTGFVGRRLPVIVNGTRVAPHQVSQMARAALASVPALDASTAAPVVQVGASHPQVPFFEFSPLALAAARVAKRVRFVTPHDDVQAFVQLLALATVRERDGVERLPFISRGDEPLTDDPKGVAGLDIDGMRRAALSMRRSLRADDRSALVDPAPVSARDARLLEAAAAPVDRVLSLLGADPSAVTEDGVLAVWSCPRDRAHAEVSARDSLRVFDGNRVHCPRCDVEKIDPVRLVMSTRRLSADEAADLILGPQAA